MQLFFLERRISWGRLSKKIPIYKSNIRMVRVLLKSMDSQHLPSIFHQHPAISSPFVPSFHRRPWTWRRKWSRSPRRHLALCFCEFSRDDLVDGKNNMVYVCLSNVNILSLIYGLINGLINCLTNWKTSYHH